MTIGQYDVGFVLDAPDDETIAKFALRLVAAGNLSTHTLRSFSEPESDVVLNSLRPLTNPQLQVMPSRSRQPKFRDVRLGMQQTPGDLTFD